MDHWSADTWIAVISLILSGSSALGVLAFYVMRNTSKDEADDAVDKLEKNKFDPLRRSVIDHDRRIIKIEGTIEALPKARDVNVLSEKISDVAGDVKAIATEIRSLHEGMARTERDVRLVTESLIPAKGQ